MGNLAGIEQGKMAMLKDLLDKGGIDVAEVAMITGYLKLLELRKKTN